MTLCASNEGRLLPSLQHHTFFLKGVVGLFFTACIGRAPIDRACSASKKDGLVASLSPSEAARCASTEDHQPPSLLLHDPAPALGSREAVVMASCRISTMHLSS